METWGDLPKSQVDPNTVDEEIDDKIQDHVDDPDAHVESGQSLESHKASQIIDHVVGSVLADKLSFTEIYHSTIFESIDGWHVAGTVDNSDFPGVVCYVEWGAVNESSCYTQPQVPSNFFNEDYDMLYQLMGRFDLSYTAYYAWWGFIWGSDDDEEGFGFQVRDGTLYAHVSHNSVDHNYEITSQDLSNDHVYRAQYNATTRTVSFYIDGALVHEYTIGVASAWASDQGPAFGIKLTEENDGNFFIGILSFSREI